MEILRKAMGSRSVVIGGCLLLIVLAMAAFAGLVFPNDPLDMVGAPLQKPFLSGEEWLGTDSTGRSVAAQLMYGARTSLLIGFIATGVAVLTGIFVGALSGFYGGWVDTLLMRITEAFQIVPSFLLGLIFHPLLLVPSAHAVIAISMARREREHREVVDAIERHGPPPGWRR